jgi:two-component system OmpR family sensor kinase
MASQLEPARATPQAPALSTRLQLLGWYMVLLAVALAAGLLLQRTILVAQVNDDINAQMRQEVEELNQLSNGRDPNTGQPFGNNVTAIFDTFLRRNIPVESEALFTVVDGQPYASSVTPLQLLEDHAVVARWAATSMPTQTELETSAGRVRYLAVPVLADDGPGGVFIVAFFLESRYAQVNQVLQTGAIIYGSIFVVASVFAWFAAGRVLRPIRLLTDAARSIKDDNWSRRIEVRGVDEIAQLAQTFNDMLDRLENAFVTQRRFIDDASHELRTPITIIRGHLEVMGAGAAERDDVKRLVVDELDRMSRMVDDLLLLARAEHPDFIDLHPIDVLDFTHEVGAKASALSAERDWRVGDTAEVVIAADPQRLTQALMNLARNAVEHSAAGSRITFGSRVEGHDIHFWVRDEGEGIPRAELDLIFDRFSRGTTSRRRSEGAGLGLAIVKTIAQAHGGRVEVMSAPAQGSTFSIFLPATTPDEGE